MNPVADIWVYLSASPLLWLTLTLAAYIGAFALYEKSRFNPLVNPVAISVLLLTGVLAATGTPYATYFEGAQFVHFLLGPATVALAVPLFEVGFPVGDDKVTRPQMKRVYGGGPLSRPQSSCN